MQHRAISTKNAITGAAVLPLLVVAVTVLIAAGQQADDRCNDACAAYRHHGVAAGEPWYRSADSWQWGFQYWLAVGGVIALIAAVGFALRGRSRVALALVLIAVAAELVWLLGFYVPIP